MKRSFQTSMVPFVLLLMVLTLNGCSVDSTNSPVTSTAPPTPQTWELKKTLSGHKDWVRNVVFTPDSHQLVSSSLDHSVRLWDIEQGKAVSGLNDDNTQYGIDGLTLTPDGRSVAFGSINVHSVGLAPISELSSDNVILKEFMFGKVDAGVTISFSPDGKTLACGAFSGEDAFFWDVDTAKRLQLLKGKGDKGQLVRFSPDGKLVAISGWKDQTVRLWDVQTGELRTTLTGHSAQIEAIAFSPDSTTFATASDDKTIKIWEIQTGALKQTCTGHGSDVNSVAFSPDGKLLASGSKDKSVKLWNSQTGALLQTLAEHGDAVITVAFSPDGKWLASAGADKTIKLWSPK